jgi:hypothetical protein
VTESPRLLRHVKFPHKLLRRVAHGARLG